MTSKTYKLVSLLLVAVFLLAACAPQAAPTVDTNEIANRVMTIVAATVSAQQAMTAAAQPQATATAVVVPATETPMLPTTTPFVIPSPTLKPSSGGGGGAPVTYSYACDPDIGKRPRDKTSFHPGDSFDVKWTIVNTGTATWAAGYDLVYSSGPKLTSGSFFQLPLMKPGDKYSVVMDAVAPMAPGYYVMEWKLQGGFCWPYIAITVE